MAFDKDAYWERRRAGKQPIAKKPSGTDYVPSTASIGFDNDGNMVVLNRQYRRRKIQIEISADNKPKKNKRKRK